MMDVGLLGWGQLVLQREGGGKSMSRGMEVGRAWFLGDVGEALEPEPTWAPR